MEKDVSGGGGCRTWLTGATEERRRWILAVSRNCRRRSVEEGGDGATGCPMTTPASAEDPSSETHTTTTITTEIDAEQHMLPQPLQLPMLAEFPVTPTFQHTELLHSTTPNIDFDTAAYMLMASDEDLQLPMGSNSPSFRFNSATSSPGFQTSKLPLPYLSSLAGGLGTPPAFDFDAIGQLLMSPNSSSFANASAGGLPFGQAEDQLHAPNATHTQPVQQDMLAGFPAQYHKSPRLNLPALSSLHSHTLDGSQSGTQLFKDYPLPSVPSPNSRLFASSLNSPLAASALPSPIIAMSQFPGSHTASSGTVVRNAVGFDSDSTAGVVHASTGYLAKRQNTQATSRELLSNTETLALESFLDSIANEGMVSKAKSRAAKDREAADNKKKRKIKALLGQEEGTNDENVSHSNTSSGGSTKRRNIPAKASAESPSAPVSESNAAETSKLSLSKQERKLVHNLTEQKRRDMIKEAFDCLHELIKGSQYDLEDKTLLEQQAKKRKRKRNASGRPMKKFEVLSRSVREIEILLRKNNSLYALLNEKEMQM